MPLDKAGISVVHCTWTRLLVLVAAQPVAQLVVIYSLRSALQGGCLMCDPVAAE
jgi:hypothetical protein